MTSEPETLYKVFSKIWLCFLLVFLASCQPNKKIKKTSFSSENSFSLFIKMPQNNLIFENVSSLAYQVICGHFRNVGYSLVDSKNEGYSLDVKITKLDSINKLISPDVLLFHYSVKLEMFCKLLDYNGNLVAEKSFDSTLFISKPQNFVMNSEFAEFEYQKLFKLVANKIEHYFRPFLHD